MADRLARIHGTEEDKVNCSFYYKIGVCRYEDKCQRIHNKPPLSQTILLKHMYKNSALEIALASGQQIQDQNESAKLLKQFEDFYEEVFLELANYGEIEDLIVCDNIGPHMNGNVYIKFVSEEDALACMEKIRNRRYDDQILMPEFSPVTDFSNAKCKQFIDGSCDRGGHCNYMHLKPLASSFKKNLFKTMYDEHPEYRKRSRRSRSKSRKKKSKKHHSDESRSRSRHKSKKEKKDKKEKDKKKKSSRSRTRSQDKEREQVNEEKQPDMTKSEERRKEIAQWEDEE